MEAAENIEISEVLQNNNSGTVNEILQNEDKKEKAKKKSSPMNPIQAFFLNVLLIITAIWLLFGFVFGFFSAPNNDMMPNVKAGDLMLYYRLDKGYLAQDIVVLNKNKTTYVGRVVAKSGDTVDITDDEHLVINGNVVIEDNIYGVSTPRIEGTLTYPVTLGEDEYFVLSDRRGGSEDSRYYGVVSGSDVNGKVVTIMRRNHL